MSGEIKVNEQAATDAASGFKTEGEAVDAAMQMLTDMVDQLANWQGSAADAGKDTLAKASVVGAELGQGTNFLGELIVNAQQTFSMADESAAAKMQ